MKEIKDIEQLEIIRIRKNNKKDLRELEITKGRIKRVIEKFNFPAIKNIFWRGQIILEK